MSIEVQTPADALLYGLCWSHRISFTYGPSPAWAVNGYCPPFCLTLPRLGTVWVETATGQHETAMRPLRSVWREAHPAERLIVVYDDMFELLRSPRNVSAFERNLQRCAGMNQ